MFTLPGKPITRSVFGHKWRAAVKAAGLPAGTGFHALRHYYASLLNLWPDSDDRTRDAIDSVLGFTADALRMEAAPTS
jgi:integrase